MIFVTVGSRQYPFDRLFRKLDELVEKGEIPSEVFAQTGTSTYLPKGFPHTDFLTPDEFNSQIAKADLVLTHGASGSIMKALNAGKGVVTVSRLAKYGEHINDHQIGANAAFAKNGYVLTASEDLCDLGECIRSVLNGSAQLQPWRNDDPLKVVREIDAFIQNSWTY